MQPALTALIFSRNDALSVRTALSSAAMTPALPEALLHFHPCRLPISRTHTRAANDSAQAMQH